MREDICAIPVNDVFMPKTGCPVCRLRDMLEERISKYITGAAMMEPSVRIETNKLGFCKDHFDMILSVGNRLSVALILESHLKELDEAFMFSEKKTDVKKISQTLSKVDSSCFMCENIEKNIEHIMRSAAIMWAKDDEFRELYSNQEYICLKHFGSVLHASAEVPKAKRKEFIEESKKLCGGYLKSLEEDTTHFCRMFDYRNKDGDFGNSKDAIERSMSFITSRVPRNYGKADEKNI